MGVTSDSCIPQLWRAVHAFLFQRLSPSTALVNAKYWFPICCFWNNGSCSQSTVIISEPFGFWVWWDGRNMCYPASLSWHLILAKTVKPSCQLYQKWYAVFKGNLFTPIIHCFFVKYTDTAQTYNTWATELKLCLTTAERAYLPAVGSTSGWSTTPLAKQQVMQLLSGKPSNKGEKFHVEMNKKKGRKARGMQETWGSLEKSSERNGELGYGGTAGL